MKALRWLSSRPDLSRPDEVRRIVPATVDIFGRLDYAFNNAEISGWNGLIGDQTERAFDETFAVNVKGLFIALQEEIQQMLKQGSRSSIVNMASMGGLVATPGASVYVASKHAVIGLTKAAAVEYGPHGIPVNALSPGAIRTKMLQQVFETNSSAPESTQLFRQLVTGNPKTGGCTSSPGPNGPLRIADRHGGLLETLQCARVPEVVQQG